MIESQGGGIGRKLDQDDPRAPLTLKRLHRPAPDQVAAAMVGDGRCCQRLELLIPVWIGDVGMHEHVTGHLCPPSLLHCISSIRRARRPVHRASGWSTQGIHPVLNWIRMPSLTEGTTGRVASSLLVMRG